MKRYFFFLLLPTLLAAGTVQATDLAQSHKPLRPLSECIDASNINEWHIINDTTMTVRTGPKRYVVKLQHKCPKLGRYGGGGVRFHPSPDKQAMDPWRICGDIGETASSRDQPPCAIQSVTPIDKQKFDALDAHAVRNGNGAEQGAPQHKH